jgi:hypothetical protein
VPEWLDAHHAAGSVAGETVVDARIRQQLPSPRTHHSVACRATGSIRRQDDVDDALPGRNRDARTAGDAQINRFPVRNTAEQVAAVCIAERHCCWEIHGGFVVDEHIGGRLLSSVKPPDQPATANQDVRRMGPPRSSPDGAPRSEAPPQRRRPNGANHAALSANPPRVRLTIPLRESAFQTHGVSPELRTRHSERNTASPCCRKRVANAWGRLASSLRYACVV